ncbi:MAG TPA: hypothetical protein VN655_13800 [Pseudolabrys sp.]|jgi:hypothetical protein|nr:hypothetical protein [Pseudolabrys sp.]
MFVALKNWRERLKHQGGDCSDRLLAKAERALTLDGAGSADLLRHFRAVVLAPGDAPSLAQLGPQFDGAEPLSTAQNLSIMASIERGAARRKRRT